jgi:sugar phosphate isomerase/epimerase
MPPAASPTKGDDEVTRPITLFTGQLADMPIAELAEKAASWGFDGLELACWGDHFEVDRALSDPDYLRELRALLDEHSLGCWAISNHLVGQAVCDVPIDERHREILPARVWGDGDPEGVRGRAAGEMIDTARAAAAFGVTRVNGFTGSSIWYMLAGFPPVSPEIIDRGYADFVERWTPVADAFQREGVVFGLEIHPAEIAYDYWTAERALRELPHPSFGINFDPSHLHWQQVDPVTFLEGHRDRIVHVHMKDAARRLDGRNGIIASHLPFGDGRRGWDFRTVGRGGVDWEELMRAINRIGYDGPLSVEWEDVGIDREVAAPESLRFVRALAAAPSDRQFDAAFSTART